jgi:WD40 repeat protein
VTAPAGEAAPGQAVIRQQATAAAGATVVQVGGNLYVSDEALAAYWQTTETTPLECPYPGLEAFGVAQAKWFFGRERLTGDLIDLLDRALRRGNGGPVVVVGPSGAGKSSLLGAGLLKAVHDGRLAVAGSADWPILQLTPGATPMRTLAGVAHQVAAAIRGLGGSVDAPPTWDEAFAQLQDAVGGAGGSASGAADGAARRVLVVADQFEELFTAGSGEAEIATFLDALSAIAAPGPGGPLGVVVLGMRADFYARATEYPVLRSALQSAQLVIGAMSSAEVTEAITRPARVASLQLDARLAERLLRDLGAGADGSGYEAGRLPLLAYALRATWQRRSGNRLTIAAYEGTGGIGGAIAKAAEDVYAALSEDQHPIARQLLLALVHVGSAESGAEGIPDARRRVTRAHLCASTSDPDAAAAVLDAFTAARLVTSGDTTVEITHDALLTRWPRLREWISQDRSGNLIHQSLEEAAAAWVAEGRDVGALYSGVRLAAAHEWAEDPARPRDLSAVARAFLAASVRHERRAVLTRRAAVAVLTAFALIASAAAVVAFQLRGQALQQRDDAIISQLATEADQLQSTDPSLAAQLTLVADRMRPTDLNFYTSLITAENTPLSTPLTGHTGQVFSVAFSPDGQVLATSSQDGTVQLWNVASSSRPEPFGQPLDPRAGAIWSVAFSPDGRTLAGAGNNGTVLLWNIGDPGHPSLLAEPRDSEGAVDSVAFNAAGNTLAVASSNGTVRLWNVANPADAVAMGQSLSADTGQSASVAFSPNGDTLAVGSYDKEIELWNVSDPAHPLSFGQPFTAQTEAISSVAFSRDNDILASSSFDGTTQLWNLADPAHPVRIGQPLNSHDGSILSVAFSPDGETLATANYDNTIRLWDVATPDDSFLIGRPLTGHTAIVSSVAFSPDGTTLASGSWDDTARLWSLPQTVLNANSSVDSVAFSPNGRILASGSFNGTIRLWNVSNPARPTLIGEPLDSQTKAIWSLAFSPDGRVLAAGSADHTIRLWDVANAADPIPFGNPLIGGTSIIRSLAFSPAGHILASSSSDGTVRLWNVSDPASPVLATQPLVLGAASGYSVAFSPNGHILATQTSFSVQLWNVTSPAHPKSLGKTPLETTGVFSVAFSSDGKILADSDLANTIYLWNVSNPNHPTALGEPLTGPTDTIGSIAFRPGGQELASGSQDETVRLWNVADPGHATPIGGPLTGHINTIWSIAWSPDGNILASGSIDGTVRLWDLRLTSAERWICTSTPNTLTRTAWQHYIPDLPYQPPCGQ